jgi:hypothetical protein
MTEALKGAKVAHTAFEKETGVPDKEWAAWYAGHVSKEFPGTTAEQLTPLITDAATIHTGEDWPEKYAQHIAEKLNGPSYETFEQQALANLGKTSRTAKGVSDTSSSADKIKLAVPEGERLAAKTEENFRGAIKMAWDERNREFASPTDVQKFAETLARKVNDGVLPAGQGLYRTHETLNNQTSPKEIKDAMGKFSSQFYEKLSTGADPVSTAAWVEKRMSVIHPWADGVGRTTKALSAFVLARGGSSLPKYPDFKTYYSEIKRSPESWDKFYRSLL